MRDTRLFAALLTPLLLSSCFPDRLVAPACSPNTYTISSLSGDTVITSRGLRYLENGVGGGPVVAWCDDVSIHYEAYLLNGTKFDDSRQAGIPLLFSPGVGALVDGLEQGVVGMRGGGKRRLIIPPELGFGSQDRKDEQGRVIVPGGSTVVYDIEVVQVGQPTG